MLVCRVALYAYFVACVLVGGLPALAQSQRNLTLPQALQRALAANPRVTVAEREIGIATGKRIQAGAIPNPEVSFEIENIYGTGVFRGTQSAETTLQLSQLVEFPGKRGARIASSTAELDSTRWQRQAERLEVLSETAIAFVNVLSGQRGIVILDTLIASLDGMTPLLQRRVDVGASSPADISRAKVAADLIRADRERAKTALAIARRELAALMGMINPDFGQAVGDLGRAGSPPPFAMVLRALENHPQLIRWTSVRAQRRAELLTARLRPYPDVRIGVGYRHFRESRDQALTFGLSAEIPLWDQNQGAVLSAQETLAKTDAERAVNKTTLLILLGRTYEALIGAMREITLLQSTVIPNAREAVRTIESGYAQGRFTLVELLDTQAAFAAAVQREQEALVTFHTAVATLEWLTGTPLNLTRVRTR